MLVGLVTLGLLGSCVLGVVSLTRLANPTHLSRSVDETPERTRRILSNYLEIAENEGAADRGLGNVSSTLAVEDYSDGSLRLTLDGQGKGGQRLLEIVATFRQRADGATDVDVFSDANKLAETLRPRVRAAALHREIGEELRRVLNQIDEHRLVPGGFLISRMIADARAGGTTIRRIP